MGISMTITTKSPKETHNIGKLIGEKVKPKDFVALIGDLGSGKTTFVQGIAEGLGIKIPVNSPSFVIVKEYQGKYPLVHVDIYRLKNPIDELFNIGFEEYLRREYIIVVEWADKIKDIFPENNLQITFSYNGENERMLSFIPNGDRFIKLIEEVKQCIY